jgi:3-oxoacyl-[acyl-carrier protein] reductase
MTQRESGFLTVDLSGRTALVTGGGTGIGRAISIGLARCGAAVAVNFRRSKKEAEETVAGIKEDGGRAMVAQADVTDESQVEQLMKVVVESFGGLDILVANAGGPTGLYLTNELTEEQWDQGLDLNCKSVFFCVKHAMPYLPDGRGRVIITGSISARTGAMPGALTYVAAKGALESMVRCWTKEFGRRSITVNAIAPGIIWTRVHEKGTTPERLKELIERIPLGREGQPEECVGAVLLLASDDGGYITGQTIEINGGMLAP